VTGNISVSPLVEQCQKRCGTNSRANSFGSACHAGKMVTAAATTGWVLTELLVFLPPSITLEVFVGIYTTGFMVVPIMAAMGVIIPVTALELVMAATGLLTWFLMASTKAWVRVLYVDGLGKLFGKFVEW